MNLYIEPFFNPNHITSPTNMDYYKIIDDNGNIQFAGNYEDCKQFIINQEENK